jgi:hypothetical protein
MQFLVIIKIRKKLRLNSSQTGGGMMMGTPFGGKTVPSNQALVHNVFCRDTRLDQPGHCKKELLKVEFGPAVPAASQHGQGLEVGCSASNP